MREVQYKVENGDVTLAGTLSGPSKPSDTLVICIHGSGPLDRDENYKAQRLDVFNPIAAALAKANVDCYRYDKRGCGQSSGNFKHAGIKELLDDALAVLRDFRQGGKYKNIILLGHSEGTAIAALAAQETIEGMILLCAFITPMEDILRSQAEQLEKQIRETKGIGGFMLRSLFRVMGSPIAQQEKMLSRVKGGDEDSFRQRLQFMNAKWIRELLNLNLSEVYPLIYCPTLIVKAGKDIQCPPEDSDKIAELIGDQATLADFPDLTHLLRETDAPAGFKDYRNQLKQGLSPKVPNAITDWISKNYPHNSHTDDRP